MSIYDEKLTFNKCNSRQNTLGNNQVFEWAISDNSARSSNWVCQIGGTKWLVTIGQMFSLFGLDIVPECNTPARSKFRGSLTWRALGKCPEIDSKWMWQAARNRYTLYGQQTVIARCNRQVRCPCRRSTGPRLFNYASRNPKLRIPENTTIWGSLQKALQSRNLSG